MGPIATRPLLPRFESISSNRLFIAENKFLRCFNFLKKINIESFNDKVFRPLSSKTGIFTVLFVSTTVGLATIFYILSNRLERKKEELQKEIENVNACKIQKVNFLNNLSNGEWSKVMETLNDSTFSSMSDCFLHDLVRNPPKKGTEQEISEFLSHEKVKGYLTIKENGQFPIDLAFESNDYTEFTLCLFQATFIQENIDFLNDVCKIPKVKKSLIKAVKIPSKSLLAFRLLDLINHSSQAEGLRTDANFPYFNELMYQFIIECPWDKLSSEMVEEIEFYVRTGFIYHVPNSSPNLKKYLPYLIELRISKCIKNSTSERFEGAEPNLISVFKNNKKTSQPKKVNSAQFLNLKEDLITIAGLMNPFPLRLKDAESALLIFHSKYRRISSEKILYSMKEMIQKGEAQGICKESDATFTFNMSPLFKRWIEPYPTWYTSNLQDREFIESVKNLLAQKETILCTWYQIYDILDLMRHKDTLALLNMFSEFTQFDKIPPKEQEIINRIIEKIKNFKLSE